MKRNLLLFLFCLPILSFGQRCIKGHVFDARTHQSIPNTTISLVETDKKTYKTQTDSSGNYIIDSSYFSPKVRYLISADKSEKPYGFLVAEDSITPEGNFLLDTVTQNFGMTEEFARQCLRFPSVQFSKNSFILSQYTKDSLGFMYKLLINNPTIIIQLDGHSDLTEKHPLKLSQLRALACKSYLVSEGIDSARVETKGWGNTKPRMEQHYINLAKTQAKKDSLAQLNRRVDFQILRWDYSKK